eukprot:691624-Rhodomonas_salina.4
MAFGHIPFAGWCCIMHWSRFMIDRIGPYFVAFDPTSAARVSHTTPELLLRVLTVPPSHMAEFLIASHGGLRGGYKPGVSFLPSVNSDADSEVAPSFYPC